MNLDIEIPILSPSVYCEHKNSFELDITSFDLEKIAFNIYTEDRAVQDNPKTPSRGSETPENSTTAKKGDLKTTPLL